MGAKLCYGLLGQHLNEDGKAFPTYKIIAKELGVSPRTAMRYVKELEDYGFLKVTIRIDKDTNTQISNTYELIGEV